METILKTSDFFYDLPEELIAQTPATPRDSAKMLVYNKQEDKVEHKIFNFRVVGSSPTLLFFSDNTRRG